MSVHNDFTIKRAEDIIFQLTIDPVTDVTGWTTVFTCKRSSTDATALFTANGSNVIPASGVIQFTLSKTNTDRKADTYAYDVYRTDSGHSSCLSDGQMTIEGTVAHP